MNWILLVMGAIVSVVAAVLLAGALVPASYAVTRTLTLRAGPDAVRAALLDLPDWPVWMALARTPQLTDSAKDVATAPAAAAAPASTIEVVLLNDERSPVSTLRIAIASHHDGTRVVATEAGTITNPAIRLLRHYVSGHLGTVDATLSALADAMGERAAPADA